MIAADLDGDGDMDLLSASMGQGRVIWYENLLLTGEVTAVDDDATSTPSVEPTLAPTTPAPDDDADSTPPVGPTPAPAGSASPTSPEEEGEDNPTTGLEDDDGGITSSADTPRATDEDDGDSTRNVTVLSRSSFLSFPTKPTMHRIDYLDR